MLSDAVDLASGDPFLYISPALLQQLLPAACVVLYVDAAWHNAQLSHGFGILKSHYPWELARLHRAPPTQFLWSWTIFSSSSSSSSSSTF